MYSVAERNGPQLHGTMKKRMKTCIGSPGEYERVPLSWVPVQDFHRDMVVPDAEGHCVGREGYVTIRHSPGTRAAHPAQPAPLLEGYLTFSGGSYAQAGRKSDKNGGVSRKGYERNLVWARWLMLEKRPRLTAWDYRKVLAECGPNDIVYLDPPYKGCNVKTYTDKSLDHEELVSLLLKARFKFVLSEYENPVYAPLGEPIRVRVPKAMMNANHTGGKTPTATECLWSNFTPNYLLQPLAERKLMAKVEIGDLLKKLEEEKAEIEASIRGLTRIVQKHYGPGRKPSIKAASKRMPKKKGRAYTKEQREAMSRRVKAAWAKRKAQGS